MANRATFAGPTRFYARSVDVTARVAIGATGAPTLITAKSRGVLNVVRNSTGNYTFQFGSKVNQANVEDAYAWTENVEVAPDISVTTGVSAAAMGQAGIFRDDVLSGFNLAPPVQAALATAAGGSLAAATYYYKVTAVDAKGKESLASNEQNIVTALNNKNTVTWAVVPGAVSYRVYRGTAAGAENVVFLVPGGATVSLVDTGALTTGASAATDPPIQARPPIKQGSVTVQLVNGSGAATDPAQGEILRFTFTFVDTTAG